MIWRTLVPIGMLLVLVVVLVVATGVIKRRATQDDEPGNSTWTLDQLRCMRDSGELTIQQYEHLRSRLIQPPPRGDADPPGGR